MIAFEVIFLFVVGIVAVVTIAAVGRPLAEAHAEKLKAQYRAMNSDVEKNLTARVSSLEEEVRELQRQLANVQETADFAVKMTNSETEPGDKIKLKSESKDSQLKK